MSGKKGKKKTRVVSGGTGSATTAKKEKEVSTDLTTSSSSPVISISKKGASSKGASSSSSPAATAATAASSSSSSGTIGVVKEKRTKKSVRACSSTGRIAPKQLVHDHTYANAVKCGFTFVERPLEQLQQMNPRKGRLPGLKRTKPQEDEDGVYKSKVMLLAAARGDCECVARMIKSGADVNYQNVHGESVAFLAAGNGIKALQQTIDLGCPLDIRTRSRQTVLHQAVREGEADLLGFVIKQGVPVDYDTWDGSTAMHIAAKYGLTDVMKLLCDNGADATVANGSGTLPLHWAIRKGELDAVSFLVEQGSSINMRSFQFSIYGDDPLHLAARKQHKGIIKVLVTNGARFKFCTSCKKGKACERVHSNWQKYVLELVVEQRKLEKSKPKDAKLGSQGRKGSSFSLSRKKK